jgi:hypothetical protein
MFGNWWISKRLCPNSAFWGRPRGGKTRGKQPSRRRLQVEILEDRLTPTTVTVMNTGDSGAGSLRDAIMNSAAGDTILFDPSLAGQPITLTGGELAISHDLTITGLGANKTTIDANHASRIFDITAGAVTLDGLTLINGQPLLNFGRGGAILSSSSGLLTIQNSTLSGNSAISSPSAEGGAIYNGGPGGVTVSNSTLSGNQATFEGGAILSEGGNVTVSNSTISGNSAGSQGGGIFTFFGVNLVVGNSTLSGNSTGGQGGGIFAFSPSVTIRSSIVAKNSGAPADLSPGSGTLTVSNSLIGDNTGAGLTATGSTPDSNGNFIGSGASPINPLLAPLGNYGGPTQTQALLPGSLAIDHGANPLGLTTDQRGDPRVVNGTADIGAFESSGFTLTLVSGDNQSAVVNTAFGAPLVVQVTSNNSVEPVAGGMVAFAAPASGASATLSTLTAVIGGDGRASVTATANGAAGVYAVTASTGGGAGAVTFTLYNVTPTPSQLAESLSDDIRSLIASGQIGNGTGTSLINAYLKQITDTSGISQIDAFISTVNKDFHQGKMGQDIANSLIDAALVIRSGLTS